MKIKVLIIDDTIFYRKIISDVLAGFPNVEVVGSANNGEIALARIRSLHPDLVTLDVEMPLKNGLEVLHDILRENLNVDCLMVSSKTERGGEITMEALELGAFDFITKPDSASPEINLAILSKEFGRILTSFSRRLEMRRKLGAKGPAGRSPATANIAGQPAEIKRFMSQAKRHEKSQAVAIGISTGGPNALARMLPRLPADIGVPLFLVQHMPSFFTSALAKNLNGKCPLLVKEAENGETVHENTVYIAPGGKHMKVASSSDLQKIIRITDDAPENNCKPAVDYLFRSMAREYGSKATCVIMTGMGSDGKLGCTVTKASGAVIIAQDEASSVVYGMPKAIVDAGLANIIAPLDKIADEILATV